MSADRQEQLRSLSTPELGHGRERMRAVVGELMTMTAITPAHDISPDDSIELGMAKLDYNALAIRALPTFRRLFELARRDFEEINAVFTERVVSEAERYEQTLAAARTRAASIAASAEGHPEFAGAATQAQEFVTRLTRLPQTEQGVYLHEGLQILEERRQQEAARGREESEPVVPSVPVPSLETHAPEPAPSAEVDTAYMQQVAIVSAIANELGSETPEEPVNWHQLVVALSQGNGAEGLDRDVAVRQLLLAVPQAVAERVRDGVATPEEKALFAQMQAISTDGTVEGFTRGHFAGWINRRMFAEDVGDDVVGTLLQQQRLVEAIEKEAVETGDTRLADAAEETRLILDDTARDIAATVVELSGPVDPSVDLLQGAPADMSDTGAEALDASDAERQTRNIVFDALSHIESKASQLFRGQRIDAVNAIEKFTGYDFSEASIQTNLPYLHMKRGDKTLDIRSLAYLMALQAKPLHQGEKLQGLIDRMVIDRQVQQILEELRSNYEGIGPSRKFGIEEACDITNLSKSVLLVNKKDELPHNNSNTQAQFTLRNMVVFLCSQRKGYKGLFEPEQTKYAQQAYDREIALIGAPARRRA